MTVSEAHPWLEQVPVLEDFAQVSDPSRYVPVPEGWFVGVCDVVNSTAAIEAGRYKAVNLAGAGAVSAVMNAVGAGAQLFAFGGDGAHFVIPPERAAAARDALARVSGWAERELGLTLRAGMTGIDDLRVAGQEVRTAFWKASEHVRYAMFIGGGLERAEALLKSGEIRLEPAGADREPDLTGLSCQWGPISPSKGAILSLIVKPAAGAPQQAFSAVVNAVVDLLDDGASSNPLPPQGPVAELTSAAIALQTHVASKSRPAWRRSLGVLAGAVFAWLVFRLGLKVGGFDPHRYRQEIAVNTDFRKFDDALMMTVDCAPETAERLHTLLDAAVAQGTVRYGMHMQDEAIMTCLVPSVMTPDHMHFVDGAGGGYASAARQLDRA